MSLLLMEKITDPSAWKGSELAGDESWVYHLSPSAVAELDSALASVKQRGLSFPHFNAEDFPIPLLKQELQNYAHELEAGRGFLLLRGLPVERYTDDDISIVYYGIGLNMGSPVRQNPIGDLLGLVMNVGDKESFGGQILT